MDNGLKCERADSGKHSSQAQRLLSQCLRGTASTVAHRRQRAGSVAVVFGGRVVEAAGTRNEASRLGKSREEVVAGFDEVPTAAPGKAGLAEAGGRDGRRGEE